MRSRVRILGAFLSGLAACASVDPRPDYDDARRQIRESTGRTEVFDPEAPPMSTDEIEAVLADGLTLDEALRLALLNNRRLQAGFARVGVAKAELVQAGLIGNPSLGMAFLFPSGGGRPKVTLDLAEDVLGIWELPARKRIASAELAREVLEVSRLAGELVAETKSAYFDSVGARELRAIVREDADVARRRAEAVRERVAGGVATESDAGLARSDALEAELEVQLAEREDVTTRRRLAALLSLEGDLQEVELMDGVPAPALAPVDREQLVALGLEQRLDLRAAAAALAAAAERVALVSQRVVPELEAGISAERPERGSDVDLLVGPGISLELPVFDRNQSRVSRAEFHRQVLQKEYEALRSEIAQDVRAAADRTEVADRTAGFVATELLPQAERTLAQRQNAYESGDTTLLPLFESRRAALAAKRSSVEALLRAVKASVELERHVGGTHQGGGQQGRPWPE